MNRLIKAACLFLFVSFTLPACVVVSKKKVVRHDNGKHKGWSNPNNPHNPSPVKKNGKAKK